MNRFFNLFNSKTKKINKPNSIAKLEEIEIHGISQCLLIRGHNIDNPLMLFLHGGPGYSEIALAYLYGREIEEHFTIVHWDQRGTGKSYSRKISKETMNVEQFISDTHELTKILIKRFKKEKIYLIGHSWGSLLGVLVAHRFPEDYYAFIGIGQLINLNENERISYEFVLNEAIKRNNKIAIQELESIKPYTGLNTKKRLIQRKWLKQFGGATQGPYKRIAMGIGSPEYSFIDIIKLIKGILFSFKYLWNDLFNYNLMDMVHELQLPVYFFTGKNDYNTPFELSERYFKLLKAPKKEYIYFEESTHAPNFEENKKYNEILISKVLKETYKIK